MLDRRLLAGIPSIRRARDFRLYDTRGRRYLDLSRDGALLGHRVAVPVMKSVLSQGLAAALPSAWEPRLAAAIARLVPEYPVVRLFSSRERALDAVSLALGARVEPEDLHDPALDPGAPGAGQVCLWRPFLPSVSGGRALLPVLPLTVCGAPAPACFPAGTRDVPPSETLPGFLLAAALRGCAALFKTESGPPLPGNRVVERALDAAKGWARTGPYVRALFPAAEYPRVHAEFLHAGVLLYPGHPGPSVLPGECSPGESLLLAGLFAGIPGG
ncbi:MAG: hypothetical protein ABSF77_11940 [Spirochaetia bacterium]|jgi:hypothetical protein